MTAIRGASIWATTLGTFAGSASLEVRMASKQTACRVVFGLGLVNLLAGLIFSPRDWLPTFVALDIIYANYAWAVWLVAAYLGSQPPLARFGVGLAAKVFATAVVIGAMLTAAGLAALAVQLWRGAAPPDLPLILAGLYPNLGLGTLHLALLAVAMQAMLGRKWLSMGVTATVWIGANLGFEHSLLRFGSPISPASGISGFGPFIPTGVAAGIYWTGFSVVLIAAGWWPRRRRSAKADRRASRPLGPNAFAVAWTAAVIWVVSGVWIIQHATSGADSQVETSGATDRASPPDPPQPVYSRLDLEIVISPLERVLVSRGTTIVVNSLDAPIPELHFGIPHQLEVVRLTMTGELAGIDTAGRCHRYRLNRPLEPGETLAIYFDLKWNTEVLGTDRRATRLLRNGTFASTSDIVPALGCGNVAFRDAPPVTFRARVGTSLDQVAVTAGTLIRAWKENGWSYYEYEAPGPIPPSTTIHSGHYAIRREHRDERIVEVFHHPEHLANTGRMIATGLAVLEHQRAAAPDRRTIRIVEVPDYRRFQRLGFLGLGQVQPPTAVPRGMVVPFSERGYPLNTPPRSESTPPRA